MAPVLEMILFNTSTENFLFTIFRTLKEDINKGIKTRFRSKLKNIYVEVPYSSTEKGWGRIYCGEALARTQRKQNLALLDSLSKADLRELSNQISFIWCLHFDCIILDVTPWIDHLDFEVNTIGVNGSPILLVYHGASERYFSQKFLKRCLSTFKTEVISVDPSFGHLLSKVQEEIEKERSYCMSCQPPKSPSPSQENRQSSPTATMPQMYGETLEKLQELEHLFQEKCEGKRRNLSWTQACQEVGIDLKTAGKHRPDLKQQWIAKDSTPRNKTKPPWQ